MIRRVLNVLTVLSPLLFVAAVALWIRGYLCADQAGWIGERWALVGESDSGVFTTTFTDDPNELGYMQFQAGTGFIYFAKRPSDYADWTHFGFDYQSDGKLHSLSVPHYAVSLPLGFLSVWLAMGVLRRRRSAGTKCARCGYDLSATPDRCPECGMTHGDAQIKAG